VGASLSAAAAALRARAVVAAPSTLAVGGTVGLCVTDLAIPDRYLMLGLTKHGPRRADAGTTSGSLLCVRVCVLSHVGK
jgi:hypothetical protein